MAAEVKPYRRYKDSGVEWLGAVPAHWETVAVRRYCRVFAGATPNRAVPEYWKGGTIPWLASGDVNLRRVVGARQFITEAGHAASSTKWIRPGSLVLALAGQGRTKGMVATVECRTTCNQSLAAIEPSFRISDHNFLAYYLESRYLDIRSLVGDGLRDGLNLEHVRAIPTPVPPISEQVAIVRFLDHADRRIRRYIRAKEKLIALLKENRTVLINHAVTKGLDPNADTHPTRSHVFPLIPRNWTLRRMRSLVQRVRRPISVRPDTEYREIGIRSWGKGIFHKDSVPGALLGEKNVFRIEPGDFVLNIVFAWEGAVSVVSENEAGMIASHRFPTFHPSPEVDVDYLLMVFQSEQGRRLLEVNSPGAAGRNRTLRIGQFLEEEIPLPTLDAQRAIISAFRHGERRLAACVGRTRQAVRQLEEFRSRMIADVVTGKLDVREAAARLPEADPPIAEGDSDDGVDSQTGPERAAWQQATEDGGALPDITDAERSEAPAGTMN